MIPIERTKIKEEAAGIEVVINAAKISVACLWTK
jgi:hypothetical protein